MGTKWEQSGKNGNKVGTKWEQEPKVGQEWEQSGNKKQWEQSGNKNPKVGQETKWAK